jgi:hypothetical protein
VVFSHRRAFAVTRCGLVTSTDLIDWSIVKTSPALITDNDGWFIAARGTTIFACRNEAVYRSTDIVIDGQGTWTRGPNIPVFSAGLAVAPSGRSIEEAVVAIHSPDNKQTEVSLVDFSTGTTRSLDFPNTGMDCCGTRAVFTVPRSGAPPGQEGPAISYDVFAADKFTFFQFQSFAVAGFLWKRIEGVHADTWSMAFPSTYDPVAGDCTAYAAHDGGVSARPRPEFPVSCLAAGTPWVLAESGLHAFGSDNMAGISTARCGPVPLSSPLSSLGR